MMKYLHPDIDWNAVKAIGFDMDGTLYDEFEFIKQVYQPIVGVLAGKEGDSEQAYIFMLNRWLEKGSSYPFIFKETLELLGIPTTEHTTRTEESLHIFRQFEPEITLSHRIAYLLESLKKRYTLFLITNGSSTLQWNKIKALKLNQYFDEKLIFVSGDWGNEYQKPSTKSLSILTAVNEFAPNQLFFTGDRESDKIFAERAGMSFLYINELFYRI